MASVYELRKMTDKWSSPLVTRTYGSGEKGLRAFEAEARVLLLHGGYASEDQIADGGHIHAGRLILTGGFSVLAGRRGIRSKGSLTVTYKKLGGAPSDLFVDKVMRGRSNAAFNDLGRGNVMSEDLPYRLLTNVPEGHANAMAAHLRENACTVRIEPHGKPEQPEASGDFIDQLERLAALRDRGVLSDAEFEAKKAEILAL